MKITIDAPQVRDEEDVADELERIANMVEGEYPPSTSCLGFEVRHDMHGYYVCTDEEAKHEDAANASVGFDGREHWQTIDEASEAMQKMAAEA